MPREPLAARRAVSPGPPGPADGFEEGVRVEIGALARQAVSAARAMLPDKGLFRRTRPALSPACYETRVDDNHHHLVCRVCGCTVDVDCAVGTRPCLQASDDHGFTIDEAEVIYWGVCPECRATGVDAT